MPPESNPPPTSQPTEQLANSLTTTGTPNSSTPRRSRRRIFLPLFIATVVIVLIGGGAFLFIRQKQANKPGKNTTQNLTPEELQRLASGTTIGNPNQSLVFEPLSVFKNKVGIDKDLLVSGNTQVSGTITTGNVTVSGDTLFNTGNFKGVLTVQGAATFRNDLTTTGNLSVGSSATVSGNLSVGGNFSAGTISLGNLSLSGHVLTSGKTPSISRGPAVDSNGAVRLSGNDTAGTIIIDSGSNPHNLGNMIEATFTTHFTSTPHIVITPVGSTSASIQYYAGRGVSNFSLGTNTQLAPNTEYTFDYLVTQ